MSKRVSIDFDSKVTGFEQGAKVVKQGVSEIKGLIAGAFTVEAISALVEKTFEYAETIDKTSLRMKLTTDQTQALSIVAREAGTSLETIEGAFKKIEAARAKALGGDAKSKALFKQLGISDTELSKQGNTVGLAASLASAAAHGSTDKEGVALQGLGLKKASGDLVAIGDSLQDLNGKVEELKANGQIIPDQDIANIIRAKEEINELGDRAMAGFAPVISGTITFLERYYVVFKAFWTNLFAAIITMGTDTLNFIKHLPTALINSAVGSKTDNLKTNTAKLADNLHEDFKDTFGTIISDSAEGLDAYNKKKADDEERRKKARENHDAGGVSTVQPAKKSARGGLNPYSDNLTSIGNMLGASFAGISQVTNQLAVAKDHLTEAKKTNDLLQDIKDNTADDNETSGDDWMNDF